MHDAVALQSDIDTRWISANGTLVNLLFGTIFRLLLRNSRRCRPAPRYFLMLAMAASPRFTCLQYLDEAIANGNHVEVSAITIAEVMNKCGSSFAEPRIREDTR